MRPAATRRSIAPRSRRAAPAATRQRRGRRSPGSSGSSWQVACEHAAVDGREACEVVERDVLVHLMRGGVQQAELGDGAVVLDEARVRGAAGGAELRGAAGDRGDGIGKQRAPRARRTRSEEHTSELQSLMRISYAVFCLKKKKQQ